MILALLAWSIGVNAQYVSGVTTPAPDTKLEMSEDDPQVKFANTITAEDMREHLTIIAGDGFEGRETGTRGNDKAADYIIKSLRERGVKGGAGGKNFKQPVAFTFTKWVDTDIFIGTKNDGQSWITGTSEMSDWSTDMDKKLTLAKKKGVKMVLIIEDDIKKMLGENRRKLLGSMVQLGDLTKEDIPTANHAYISTTIAKDIIGKKGKKIIKSRKRSNKKAKACDVALPTQFVINQSKDDKVLKGNNILAFVEGSDKKDEIVVVSAHYDHLGKRGDDVYNGADDNGSGTTTVLELAEAFQKAKDAGNGPSRSILFLWVTGEEKGLLGSEYYAANPIYDLANTVVDVNVDMVGRVDEKYADNPNYIYVIGSDRLSSDLHKINEDANAKYAGLTLDYTYNSEEDPNRYYFRSDHYNFAKNGIPAIFFFNGVHADYHMASDTVEKINFEKMEKVGRLIFHTTWELANRAERIVVDGEVK